MASDQISGTIPGRIATLQRELDDRFRADPDVFVAANLPWYLFKGDDGTQRCPALMVVFGRPKGHRDAYRQWQEGKVAPQVIFEVLPLDDRVEPRLRRYERLGVEEYYVFDAESGGMTGWVETSAGMELVHQMARWYSPRLNTRIVPATGELRTGPPQEFSQSFVELTQQCDELEREIAEIERQRAEAERKTAEYRRLAERLAARLRELGEDVE